MQQLRIKMFTFGPVQWFAPRHAPPEPQRAIGAAPELHHGVVAVLAHSQAPAAWVEGQAGEPCEAPGVAALAFPPHLLGFTCVCWVFGGGESGGATTHTRQQACKPPTQGAQALLCSPSVLWHRCSCCSKVSNQPSIDVLAVGWVDEAGMK